MTSKQPSVTGRAILAVVLMIGFYALAILIAAALLYILYAMVVFGQRINIRVAIFAIIGAAIVLWSIIPRRDKFVRPGPKLDPNNQPKFFKTVEEIAQATDQSMPEEIFLISDVNAWVANRGGVMGFGSRRVMGVGLPLLQIMTVSEFRAVLAHEFGHYYGGDTRLGPWVYKTRGAIGRTIGNLSQHSSLLQKPFLWYGTMFLRITQSVSRQQEYAADALASRVVGSRPLIDGLKKIHSSAMVYNYYWSREISPVLRAGYHPPLSQGFDSYIRAPYIKDAMDEVTQRSLQEAKTNPYDTHPPLKSRIEAAADYPSGPEKQDDDQALSLLEHVEELESELFEELARLNDIQKLKPLAWDDVGEQIYLPAWKEFVARESSYLKGITPASLPEIASNMEAFSKKFPGKEPEERRSQANSLIGSAIAVGLHDRGWVLHRPLNEPVHLSSGDLEITPFRILEDLKEGEIEPKAWQQLVEAAGISDLDLSKVAN